MTTQSATPLPPVIVYSGPLCSGCAEVEAYLDAQGIAYEERDIRGAIETMIEFRRKGYEILPVIEVGAHVVGEYRVRQPGGRRPARGRVPAGRPVSRAPAPNPREPALRSPFLCGNPPR